MATFQSHWSCAGYSGFSGERLQGQAREGSSGEEAWVHLCVPQMTNVGSYILA